MVEIVTYPEEKLPAQLKSQLITMRQMEWATAFEGEKPQRTWLHDPANHPTCMALIKDDTTLIGYAGIVWKYIEHKGETYKAYGLSGVITNPAFRRQGYGQQLITAAYHFIKATDADIGLFTCDPPLQPFYEASGWQHLEGSYLVGGTRVKPFSSQTINKVTMVKFFSAKAKQQRTAFEGVSIYLELAEGDLW